MAKTILICVACACMAIFCGQIAAQSTAFTYQGQLKEGGSPANGSYDLSFTLHSVASGSAPVGSTVYIDDKAVANGLFTAEVDFNFGAISFNGADRWLEIGVRAGSISNSVRTGYTALTPRQKIMPTPYAIMSQNSAKLGGREAAEYLTATTDNWVNTTGDSMTGALNITGSAEELLKSTNSHASGSAVSGTASGADGIGGKFYGTGSNGRGVYAYTSAPNAWAIEAFAEGEGTSVAGRFDAVGGNNSKAVEGVAGNDSSITNYGGHFTAEGNMGEGVYGKSSGANGIGVHGEVNGVNAFGGSFSSTGTNGRGVYAYTSAANAWALEAFAEGEGTSVAGHFESTGVTGQAIYGYVNGASAKALVVGHSNNNYAHLGTSEYAALFNGPTKFQGNVDGNLTVTGDYKYSAAKKYIKHYPAHGFSPTFTGDLEKYAVTPDGYTYLASGGENYAYGLCANVDLPQGAKITELRLYVYDNYSQVDLNYDVYLKRRYYGSLSATNVATLIGATSGQSTNIRPYSTTTITNPTIDKNYSYYLNCTFTNSGTYVLTYDLRFYEIWIEYEITALQP